MHHNNAILRIALVLLLGLASTSCTMKRQRGSDTDRDRDRVGASRSLPMASVASSMSAAPMAALVRPSTPKPSDPDATRVAEKYVTVLERIAKVATSTRGSCDHIAGAMEGVIRADRPAIDEMQNSKDTDALRRRYDELDNRFGVRVDTAIKNLEPVLDQCMGQARLDRVLDVVKL